MRFSTDETVLRVEVIGNRRRFTTKDAEMPGPAAENGRGTALMLKLVDRVRYVPTEGGLAVCLEKIL